MIPKPHKQYQLKYQDPNEPSCIHYVGPGTYTGEIDQHEPTLYFFRLPNGELGSFDEDSIVHELVAETQTKTNKHSSVDQITISKSEYNELKENSRMLGIIASYVEDFCDEDDTTLIGVQTLLRDYYNLQSDLLSESIAAYRREICQQK